MSLWTEFRDQSLKGLGIDTGANAAKTLGNVTAQQLKAGVRGGSPQTAVKPAPQSAAAVRSGGIADSLSIGGISGTIVLVVGIAAIFYFSKRRR